MITEQLPPNFKQIELYVSSGAFEPAKGEIYPYAPYIFNPNKTYIDAPLLVHMITHILQQEKMGVKAWWDKYLRDKSFRLEQEIEAFQTQYRELKKEVSDRERLYKITYYMAKDLQEYGLSHSDAMRTLKSEKLIKVGKTSSVQKASPGILKQLGKLMPDWKWKRETMEGNDAKGMEAEIKTWEAKNKKSILLPFKK